MRIVYTVLNGRVAGGQIICLKLLLAARRRGHEVLLVTPSPGELTDLLEREGVPWVTLPMQRTFHLQQTWKFARMLRSWRADLVHCHDTVAGSILARIGARLAGVPMICHVHSENKFSETWWIQRGQRWLDNFTSRWTDQILTISEDTRRSLIQQGLPQEKITVVPNGVAVPAGLPEARTVQARTQLALPEVSPVVGTVGRLCPTKGQEEFLRAAVAVRSAFPDTIFVIVGQDIEFDGSYRAQLERLAQELKLEDSVKFAGFQPDASALMAAFTVFTLPSWIEGMPVTILEAMAVGVPVVATPVGGVAEVVVDGESGLLVPPRDPDRLAGAILQLLRNRDLRTALGAAGHQRVKRLFTEEKMIERVMAAYHSARPR